MNRKPETDTDIFCITHKVPVKRFKNGQRFKCYGAHGERIMEQRYSLICTRCIRDGMLRRQKLQEKIFTVNCLLK